MLGVLAQGPIQTPSVAYFALSPVLVILGAACLGVLVEAFLPRHQRWAAQVSLALLAAGVLLGAYASSGAPAISTVAGAISVDRPTLFLWGTLLALGLGGVLLISDRSVEPGGAFVTDAPIPPGTPQDRITASQAGMQTEVLPLTLFALGGMMCFCAANDLLTMFVALEVLSLPLYLLCGLARRRRLLSQEAAVKYFLLGAFASAFFLYGLALLYGYAGSLQFADINEAVRNDTGNSSLLLIGMGMLAVG